MAVRLAAQLEDRGHRVVVARGGGVDTTQVLADFVATAIGADVVVPHSNAGRFGPAVAAEVGAKLVCLDSLLPGREPDPEWVEFLRTRELADGLLAPWSTWWPRQDIQATVGEHWDLLTTDEPRVPLRLLIDEPPTPAAWLERRSGYIAFGDTYAEQMALADKNGWEVRRLEGGHLLLLTTPNEVAETLLDVVSRLDSS
ncbi:MAG: hypothetical protein ABI776_14155 [Nocardioidaceae bacterium]